MERKTQLTADELLNQLAKQDALDNQPEKRQALITRIVRWYGENNETFPLYLRALIGIGAFFICICAIGFLSVTELIDITDAHELVNSGIFFMLTAIGLQFFSKDKGANTVIHNLIIQLSFGTMVLGKSFFVFGTYQVYDMFRVVPLALLIVAVATYPFFKMAIDRFLSCLFTLLYTLAVILFDEQWHAAIMGNVDSHLDNEAMRIVLWLFIGFFLLQLVLAGLLLMHGKIKAMYRPLAYALVVSLCTCNVVLILQRLPSPITSIGSLNILLSAILAVSLLATAFWVVGDRKRLIKQATLVAVLAIVLLAAFSMPGVLFALILIVLGYARRDDILTAIGLASILIFLCAYYYFLQVTLLVKSMLLIGSGAVLLAAAGYIRYKGWDKDAVSCKAR